MFPSWLQTPLHPGCFFPQEGAPVASALHRRKDGMLWHRRFDNQAAHLWLRKLIQQTAASR